MGVGVEDLHPVQRHRYIRRAARPPSRGSTAPLVNDDASHTSCTRPSRFIGRFCATPALIASGSGAMSVSRLKSPASVGPSDSTLTRTLSGACSIATCLHRLVSPNFDAQYAGYCGATIEPSVEPIATT